MGCAFVPVVADACFTEGRAGVCGAVRRGIVDGPGSGDVCGDVCGDDCARGDVHTRGDVFGYGDGTGSGDGAGSGDGRRDASEAKGDRDAAVGGGPRGWTSQASAEEPAGVSARVMVCDDDEDRERRDEQG